MGRFLNPDNSAFQTALNSEIYVDKTGLIDYTNRVINTKQAFICNSRPRRFGKSITADMLAAYYSKGCDAEDMFAGLEIGSMDSFRTQLNKHDVIHFDVQWCLTPAQGAENVVSFIEKSVIEELRLEYPGILDDTAVSLPGAMSQIHAKNGNKFIVIIDEWDVLIRDETNTAVQEAYIDFLRGMFKGTEPTRFISLAYLTGILPVKKQKTQSALNNFDEYTMLDAGALAPYMGFTEEEVRELSEKYGRDFSEVVRWYDGYWLSGLHIYNPQAAVSVMLRGNFQSYWSQTGTFESIRPFINMNFDGLKTAIIEMISGNAVEVNTNTFRNDMVSFQDRDDVLTLLIHLGYLAYDQEKKTAFIPNEEIRQEFLSATQDKEWNELIEFELQSNELLDATLDMEAEVVAAGIEKIHTEYASAIRYNDENSLSSVLTIAYLSSMRYYFKPVRELPTGRGFADFVYIPKPEYRADYPALLVELKWNQNANTALEQIRDKQYPASLEQYTGNILLVGISYDRKDKKHQCLIGKYEK